MKINNPHDKFFKKVLSNKENAQDFVRTFLPQVLLKHLNLDTLKHENISYVDNKLKAYFADAVLNCQLISGQNLKITILIEHKSFKDQSTLFQTLNYLSHAYLSQYRANQKISLIVPVIFYHNNEVWQLRKISDIFQEYPIAFTSYAPIFETLFVDVHRMKEEQILSIRNLAIASMLAAQKLQDDPLQLFKIIESIFENFPLNQDRNFVKTLFVYIFNVVTKEVKVENLMKNLSPKLSKEVKYAYEYFVEEGIEKGIEKGKRELLIQNVLRSFENGLDIGLIAKIMQISEDEVIKIVKQENN